MFTFHLIFFFYSFILFISVLLIPTPIFLFTIFNAIALKNILLLNICYQILTRILFVSRDHGARMDKEPETSVCLKTNIPI